MTKQATLARPFEPDWPADSLIVAAGFQPADDTTRCALWREICSALSLLTDNEVLVLRHLYGVNEPGSTSQAAAALGLSEAWVACYRQRALDKINTVMPLSQLEFVGCPSPAGWPVRWRTAVPPPSR